MVTSVNKIKNPSNGFLIEVIELLSLHADPRLFEEKIRSELRLMKECVADGFKTYKSLLANECPFCSGKIQWESDFFSVDNVCF
jgi:hypothetical protein